MSEGCRLPYNYYFLIKVWILDGYLLANKNPSNNRLDLKANFIPRLEKVGVISKNYFTDVISGGGILYESDIVRLS
jgi:hypothetical protein